MLPTWLQCVSCEVWCRWDNAVFCLFVFSGAGLCPCIPFTFVVNGMHGWMTYAWKKLTQTALEWCRMEIVSQTPKSNIRVWHKCTLDEQANILTDTRRILVETLLRRVKANSILTPMDLEWDVIKAPVVDKWLITFACIVCFVITSQSYKGKT